MKLKSSLHSRVFNPLNRGTSIRTLSKRRTVSQYVARFNPLNRGRPVWTGRYRVQRLPELLQVSIPSIGADRFGRKLRHPFAPDLHVSIPWIGAYRFGRSHHTNVRQRAYKVSILLIGAHRFIRKFALKVMLVYELFQSPKSGHLEWGHLDFHQRSSWGKLVSIP